MSTATEVTASVREIKHTVHVDLTDAPPITTAFSKRRRPAALILEYGVRRDVHRVDITVQWRNGYREHFPPAREMPEWMRRIVEANRPADVDSPDSDRRTGMGGWPLPRPAATAKDPDWTDSPHDPAALHNVVVRGLCAVGFSPEDAARYAKAHQDDIVDLAADVITDEAWPHERPESENQALYRLADLVRGMRLPGTERP